MRNVKRIGKPIYAPGVMALGFSKHSVSQGDLIVYREIYDNEGNARSRVGRVLGAVTHDGMGVEYRAPARRGKGTRKAPRLLVLACDDAFHHAYERHVDVNDVTEIRTPPNPAFVAWFFGGALPDAETIIAAAKYGALNDRYFTTSEKTRGW